jgi:hypothetical protein
MILVLEGGVFHVAVDDFGQTVSVYTQPFLEIGFIDGFFERVEVLIVVEQPHVPSILKSQDILKVFQVILQRFGGCNLQQ